MAVDVRRQINTADESVECPTRSTRRGLKLQGVSKVGTTSSVMQRKNVRVKSHLCKTLSEMLSEGRSEEMTSDERGQTLWPRFEQPVVLVDFKVAPRYTALVAFLGTPNCSPSTDFHVLATASF